MYSKISEIFFLLVLVMQNNFQSSGGVIYMSWSAWRGVLSSHVNKNPKNFCLEEITVFWVCPTYGEKDTHDIYFTEIFQCSVLEMH